MPSESDALGWAANALLGAVSDAIEADLHKDWENTSSQLHAAGVLVRLYAEAHKREHAGARPQVD
jgi:hypothetical protein